MARIIPDGWRELSVTGAAQREIETLAVLADGLPDEYSVYHAVHWTGMDGRYAIYGEIDFAVVNLAGDLLLIEQKSGFLDETPDGLVKQYPGRSKSVPVQISRMVSNLRGKLAVRGDIPSVHTDALLYCPDYTVRNPETAGLVPERIVDAARRDQLCQIIQRLLPASRGNAGHAKDPCLPARPDPARHRCQRADGPCPKYGHPGLRRPRALGTAPRVRTLPPARHRHRRLGQDPTRPGRVPRHARSRQAAALCLLQPPAGGPFQPHRPKWRAGLHLPPAL